ncbi:hypothetical protein ACVCIC_04865 [Burkholderia glumae]|uniref:Uncharacterized protein n=1 Tax=Burkholderia glumae TaxID=337 RepID=A0ABY5B9M5_BURGL|nr:hypothetical protein [Burkholderia glumae]MCM2483369.1 hypothetical protein [Burkholderia glumae]MCM2511271.1 hypothetical protein [Burkholderia glumae]MCM2541146.1 hypothetical protein [Burkholderia glumae]MCM2544893.1 hypothetical protein [Burkholderia glumae]MCM2550483.1 hypothetical protein [Burkholderia glumae]
MGNQIEESGFAAMLASTLASAQDVIFMKKSSPSQRISPTPEIDVLFRNNPSQAANCSNSIDFSRPVT